MRADDEIAAKLQAEKAYYAERASQGDRGFAPAPCIQGTTAQSRPFTLKDEAGKAAEHHSSQAQKFAAAHAFLSAHPEFDEFIWLIRNGSLQF